MNQFKYILIVFVLLIGCKRADDIVTSYGKDTEQTRQVGNFRAISAGEKFDIFLIQDSALAGTVKMTAGEHVIDGYVSEVRNGVLVLENINKYNWVRKLRVRQKAIIYFKNLDSLSIRGSAKFTSKDPIIQQNEFKIIHNGLENVELTIYTNDINVRGENTGGIILHGKCNIYRGNADDISFVDNRDLITDDTYFNSFSQEDSYVNAKNILGLKVFGNGNIYYISTPSNKSLFERYGKGDIILK
ncbi:MAG: DUF2807 domain-containing protein [bacterium]|nr:DUF2807 domain-containing protein [bacterium]